MWTFVCFEGERCGSSEASFLFVSLGFWKLLQWQSISTAPIQQVFHPTLLQLLPALNNKNININPYPNKLVLEETNCRLFDKCEYQGQRDTHLHKTTEWFRPQRTYSRCQNEWMTVRWNLRWSHLVAMKVQGIRWCLLKKKKKQTKNKWRKKESWCVHVEKILELRFCTDMWWGIFPAKRLSRQRNATE